MNVSSIYSSKGSIVYQTFFNIDGMATDKKSGQKSSIKIKPNAEKP